MKKTCKEILGFLSIIFLTSCVTYSQENSFKVLAFYGEVDFQSSTTQPWERVQTGVSFYKEYKIRLGKNSYSALMYKDGRTMEIMKEGIFNVDELERNILASKISVTQKFANFVAEEIIVDKSKGKSMDELAAVVRVKPFHIESAIPSFNSFLDPVIDCAWYRYHSSKMYVINILSSENTTIFMDLTDDTTYTFDTTELNLRKGSIYKWYVFDADNPNITSDTNFIAVLSEENRKSILDTVQILKEEVTNDESPLTMLSLGSFYERNNLNIEALMQFNKVIEMASESEEYKIFFAKFLLKNKLYVRVSELFEEN